jgi:hypothetical protein
MVGHACRHMPSGYTATVCSACSWTLIAAGCGLGFPMNGRGPASYGRM